MRISDWSSDVCSSDLSRSARATPISAQRAAASRSAATTFGCPRRMVAGKASVRGGGSGIIAPESTSGIGASLLVLVSVEGRTTLLLAGVMKSDRKTDARSEERLVGKEWVS